MYCCIAIFAVSTVLIVNGLPFNKDELVLDITQIYHVKRKNSEYYWRNYTGRIPSDAVPGGRDIEGKITYIGQTKLSNGSIIPGEIDPTNKTLYYYYIAVGYGVTKNVRILCSEHLEKFDWVKTNVTEMKLLTGKHLVPGGFDDGYPVLIGRANIGQQIVVGKITIYYKYRGFAYAEIKTAKRKDEEYEILCYNP